jgi:type II secretory pathway component PulK
MKKLFKKEKNNKKGMVLFGVLIFSIIAISIVTALVSWFGIAYKNSRTFLASDQAFHLAEAGIDYSRSHDLSGATSTAYVYDLMNSQNEAVGSFAINFVASTVASTTQITIESTGYTAEYPDTQRKIRLDLVSASSTESINGYKTINWQEIK